MTFFLKKFKMLRDVHTNCNRSLKKKLIRNDNDTKAVNESVDRNRHLLVIYWKLNWFAFLFWFSSLAHFFFHFWFAFSHLVISMSCSKFYFSVLYLLKERREIGNLAQINNFIFVLWFLIFAMLPPPLLSIRFGLY